MFMSVGIVSLIIVFVVLLFVARLFWERSRSMSMIEHWAHENGLHLASASRCYWTLGTPFWAARNQKNRTVYRIAVEDSLGNSLSGYALCGGLLLGLITDRVEVKFDPPDPEKRKNDAFEKPKNDFRKRKNGWESPDFEETENDTYDTFEKPKNDFAKRKNGV
jgi:hypothetical protein